MKYRERSGAFLCITALLLFFAILSVFLALPFHHCEHGHTEAQCRLCLLAAGLRSDGPAAAAAAGYITEYCRQEAELQPCLRICFIPHTLTTLKTKMDN